MATIRPPDSGATAAELRAYLIDLTTTRARDANTARYMQTKARAAGERKRWATDTENVGRTFVDYGRQTGVADAGTRWQSSEARLGKPRVGGVGVGLPSDYKPARAGLGIRGTA